MSKAIFFLFFLLFLVTSYLFPVSVSAQGTVWSSRCVQTVKGVDVPTIQGFECLFANILKIIVTVAGLAFLVIFIAGGFQYMQSSGDPKATAAASSTLTYAIIGLVGIIVSWLIIAFISQFTGIDVNKFEIPGP